MLLRHGAAGALTLALASLGASSALGQTDGKDTLSFAFTSAKAKTSAGYNVEGEFPRRRIIDQLTINFPPGTKIDTANVQRCATNDAAITGAANGVRDVCPAQSKVGTGKGTAYLGDAADPITFDLGVYNVAGGAIIDIMLNDKTAFYSVAKISGRKMTVPLDQTPSLNSRITAFELSIKKAGGARQPYVRTPATCPKSRKLSASMAAREHNAGTVTTKDTTACTK
jgi:hypothetical protein